MSNGTEYRHVSLAGDDVGQISRVKGRGDLGVWLGRGVKPKGSTVGQCNGREEHNSEDLALPCSVWGFALGASLEIHGCR